MVLGYQPENVGKHAYVDALVFFGAKISRNGSASFLWPYITSFTVTGVCGIHGRSISGCPVSPGFLSSQGSHPASRELKSCVSVEALLNRGYADADGFLEQQFTGMSGHVHHCSLIPLDGMLVLPCMFSYCRLLQCPFPAGFLLLSQPCLQTSSGLTDVDLAATVWTRYTTLHRFSIGRGSFTRVSTEWSDSLDLKMSLMTLMPYFSADLRT